MFWTVTWEVLNSAFGLLGVGGLGELSEEVADTRWFKTRGFGGNAERGGSREADALGIVQCPLQGAGQGAWLQEIVFGRERGLGRGAVLRVCWGAGLLPIFLLCL